MENQVKNYEKSFQSDFDNPNYMIEAIKDIMGDSSWIDFGNHEKYFTVLYDHGKIETSVSPHPMLISITLDQGEDHFILHLDDNIGAFVCEYPRDLLGLSLLRSAYLAIRDYLCSYNFSYYRFVHDLEEMHFKFMEY